jgi:hypothetical protein
MRRKMKEYNEVEKKMVVNIDIVKSIYCCIKKDSEERRV